VTKAGRADSEFEREKAVCAAWFQPDLTDEDRAWLRKQFEIAGLKIPTVDISWVEMESI
jgi:hypothetical protein